MFTRLFVIATAIGSLALLPAAVNASEVTKPCRVLIQFYNEGSPGVPGIVGDGRYGIRLNVADVGYVLLPANTDGYVGFYVAPDTVVPYSYSRLAFDPLGDEFGVPGEASCGFTAIHVPAGN